MARISGLAIALASEAQNPFSFLRCSVGGDSQNRRPLPSPRERARARCRSALMRALARKPFPQTTMPAFVGQNSNTLAWAHCLHCRCERLEARKLSSNLRSRRLMRCCFDRSVLDA